MVGLFTKPNRVKILLKCAIDFSKSPLLREKFYGFVLKAASEHFAEKIKDQGAAYLRMNFLTLCDKSYAEFKEELEQVYFRFQKLSGLEELAYPPSELKKMSYIALADQWIHPAFKNVVTNID